MFNEGMVPCFGVLVLVPWNGERWILKPRLFKHAFCFELAILRMKINAYVLCFFVPIILIIDNVVSGNKGSMA